MSPDHNKISITAKLVPYYRSFSDIPFAEDVARLMAAVIILPPLMHWIWISFAPRCGHWINFSRWL